MTQLSSAATPQVPIPVERELDIPSPRKIPYLPTWNTRRTPPRSRAPSLPSAKPVTPATLHAPPVPARRSTLMAAIRRTPSPRVPPTPPCPCPRVRLEDSLRDRVDVPDHWSFAPNREYSARTPPVSVPTHRKMSMCVYSGTKGPNCRAKGRTLVSSDSRKNFRGVVSCFGPPVPRLAVNWDRLVGYLYRKYRLYSVRMDVVHRESESSSPTRARVQRVTKKGCIS